MCSLHLTHPSVHTWSSGQPTVQRPGSSRGLPVGAGIRTHNLGLPRVSSPTLYPLGQRAPNDTSGTPPPWEGPARSLGSSIGSEVPVTGGALAVFGGEFLTVTVRPARLLPEVASPR